VERLDGDPQRIVFLMPDSSRPIAGRFVYDEFGYVSSSHEWTCRGMTGLAVLDVAPDRVSAVENAQFIEVPFGEPLPEAEPQTWTIDAGVLNAIGPRPKQVTP
jgi:hypothetical protein